MNPADLDTIKSVLDELKIDLAGLKEKSSRLSEKIESNYLPSEEMTAELLAALKSYREKTDLLQRTGAAISISIEDNIALIDEKIEAAEKKARLSSSRQIVLDYFRLTTTAESVRLELEDSKQALMKNCNLPADKLYAALEPYRLVVTHVRDSSTDLSDEEFDAIEHSIGRPIARAADKNHLSIDPEFELSSYLDNSCPLLKPETENSLTDTNEASLVSEEESKEAEIVAESTSEPEPITEAESEPMPEPPVTPEPPTALWDHFDGYVGDTTVSFTDVPASTLGASKFINMAKQRDTIPLDLFLMAHQKFLEETDWETRTHRYIGLSNDSRNFLVKQGFLTNIQIINGSLNRSFLMLTSKAWACYTKNDVVKFFNKHKLSMMVPRRFRMKPADFTPINALKVMMLHDYFTHRSEQLSYLLVTPDDQQPLFFAYERSDSSPLPTVIPAIFEVGNEAKQLEEIRSGIMSFEEDETFHIVAFSKSDIVLLSTALALEPAVAKRVSYCVVSDPEILLDGNGIEIISEENEEELFEEPVFSEEAPSSQESEITNSNEAEITFEPTQLQLDEIKEIEVPSSAVLSEVMPTVTAPDDSFLNKFLASERAPTDDEFYSFILDVLRGNSCRSFNENSNIVQALMLAKSAAATESNKKCQALYSQLLLATKAPLDICSYSSENLTSVLLDSYTPPEALTLSAYMIALIAPETPWDYGLKSQADAFLSGYEGYFPSLSVVKPLFSKLHTIHETSAVGFSESILAKLGSNSEHEKYMRKLSSQAKSHLEVSKPKTRIKALPHLYSTLFGKGSDLYNALDIISSGKKADREIVELVLDDYCDKKDGVYAINDDKVDVKLNESWFAVNSQGSAFTLDFTARQQALRQINIRLRLMIDWVSQLEDRPTSTQNLARLKKLRDDIVSLTRSTRSSVLDADIDFSCIILRLLNYIENYLSLAEKPDAGLFDELAITGVITLDENRMPVWDDSLNSVKYFEPWRRVLMHMSSEVDSLDKAMDAILAGGEESDLFDNLRQLEVIGDLKGNPINTGGDMLSEAKKSADDRTTRFEEKLELAFTYDRISETEKESLAAIEAKHKDFFYELRDFGVWRQLLKALEKRIDTLAEAKLIELRKSLQTHRDALAAEGKTSSILEDAHILLEEKLNFAVTEEYINRFEKGEMDFSEDLQAVLSDKDSFADFISDQTYLPIFQECFRGKAGNFRNLAREYLLHHTPKDWTARLRESSEKLIANWPIRFGQTTATQIKDLFTEIGLNVTRAISVSGKKNEDRFRLDVVPSPKSMADYRHPIAAFGTQMKSPLNVVVLYGNVPPKQLVDQITEMGMGGMTIVILNYPISLLVRRQIAEEFHKTSGQNRFMLIDQVLFMYLAMHQQTERLPVMLKCTLPFTTYQPFVFDGGPTADEMFCGRSKELADIISPNGACVVYGGRQLGKTALLERAESLSMKPENRAYAVYCNILSCDSEAGMVEKVVEDVEKKAGIKLGNCKNIKDLSNAFERLFREQKITSMILLLDETDKFLESIAPQGYTPLQPLIDLRRSSKNSFKFVLAGLHNVCRAKNATERNGVFGQLGTPLCVKPLSPTDALQLLSRPLKYLGFQIDRYPHLETILTKTNYYPGILQFFGYMLVQTVSTQYSKYYRASDENPPFTLQDEQLGAIMNSADLNKSIRDKFRWSLELDKRYFMIARCIAVLYYLSDDSTNSWLGFSIEEIMEIANQYGILCLKDISANDYKNLLDEMVDMGILSKPEDDRDRYRLRRNSFINIIGSNFDAVDEDILRDNSEV